MECSRLTEVVAHGDEGAVVDTMRWHDRHPPPGHNSCPSSVRGLVGATSVLLVASLRVPPVRDYSHHHDDADDEYDRMDGMGAIEVVCHFSP